jgi:Flp pilus assembly protein TadG
LTPSISRKSERGQTTTEFALVLPVLALLLFGVIQFGLTFKNYLSLTDAVRAGARKAAVSRQMPDPVGAAVSQVRASAADLNQTNLTVTVTSPWTPASDVKVTGTYPYSIHLLGIVVVDGQLKSSTTERVE